MTGLVQLQARLTALRATSLGVSQAWAAAAATQARTAAPSATGRTRASVHATEVNAKGAKIEATGGGKFVQTGVRAHDIEAHGGSLRFKEAGRTIFAKKVHKNRQAPRPWMDDAAERALERLPLADIAIADWNAGA